MSLIVQISFLSNMSKGKCIFNESYCGVKKNIILQAACLNYHIVNTYEKYLYFPAKRENHLTNEKIYDLETFNRDRE